MRRALPPGFWAGSIFVLLLLVRPAWCREGPAHAAETAPITLKVRIEMKSGPEVHGTLDLAGLRLKTETGSQTIDSAHLRRITFALEADERAQDSVQLTDRTIVRGRVLQENFTVQANGQNRDLAKAEIREIVVLRDEHVSLVSLIVGLVTLAGMEIILGIDNIIFLAIVAGRLPVEQQPRARKIGLAAALGTRLLLLFSLSFLLGLTTPLFTLPDLPFLHDLEAREVSWRDIVLLAGGVFLIGKSVHEMHEKLEHSREAEKKLSTVPAFVPSFARVIATIAVIDIVFSLDSVITAVGMVDHLWIMVTAMVMAMGVMLLFAEAVARFVERYPTVKVLALSFLILIGAMLVAEGLGQHIDKGYIYFAMAFAVAVEVVNLRLRNPNAALPPHEV